jgi:hypothetical protein
MSHGKTEIDVIESVESTWHNRETRRNQEDFTLETSWLAKYDYVKRPLYRLIPGIDPIKTDTCEITCTDDPQIVVGQPINCDSYGLITNRMFIDMIGEALLSIRGAKLATVGSVCGRSKVFVSISLPDLEWFKAAGHEYRPFLNFGNGFDKQTLAYSCASIVRTVCQNTDRANLTIAKGDKSVPVNLTLRHTKNAPEKIANIAEIVDGFYGAAAQFRASMETLASQPIASVNARNYFAGLLANGEKEEEISTRRVNQVDRLADLFVSGRGNRGETRLDCYNAVTDYASHESSGGMENPFKQIASSEFGAAAVLKTRALSTLRDESKFAEFVTAGEFSLANA